MINATLIVFAVFWSFFVITNNVANDFSYLSNAELLSRFSIPQIWQERISEGFGQYALAILWNWPLDFLYGLLGRLGFSFSIIQLILFLIPFIFVGYYSIKKFLTHHGLTGGVEVVGIFFYLINPYVILLIDGGQLSIALAYVFLPFAYVSFIESINKGFKDKLKTGLTLSLLGFLDVRYLYLLSILTILKFVFLVVENKKNFGSFIVKFLSTSFIAITVFVSLNLYWLLPSLIARAPSLPAGYSDISQVSNLSFTDWKHAVLFQPANWYKNVFGNVSSIDKSFLVIPLLVLSGFLAGLKKKKVWSAFTLTAVGLILVKGATVPFPGIYKYLFEHVPGFSLFRDSTKFYIFIALGYSYFLSLLVQAAQGFSKSFKKFQDYIPRVLIIVYLLLLIRPVWLGQMTGILSNPIHEDTYKVLWKKLEDDNNFGRVLWLPAQPPLGYSSPVHPSVELSRMFSQRPFVTGVVGSYETNNFIREANYMGQLFDVLGIKYIAFPYPDVRRQELKQDNIDYYHAFSDQVSNLPWIEGKISDYPVNVFKTNSSKDKFFVSENTWIVVGDDEIYRSFAADSGLSLSDNALIFAEENTDFLQNSKNASVLFKDVSSLDFAFLPGKYFLFPAKDLPSSPGENGWWSRSTSDFLWMRNFLQTKYEADLRDFDYGGGYAISEGNNDLTINDNRIKKDDMLFARVMNTKRGGSIVFYQKGEIIGEANSTNKECPDKVNIKLSGYKNIPDQNLEYNCAYFSWIDLGKSIADGELTVKTYGDVNMVNAIVSVPEEFFEEARNKLASFETIKIDDFPHDAMSMSSSADVRYERLAPTHYKVHVTGLNTPSTLVFSETYDPLWRIYDQDGNEGEPYKLYSLINGFHVEKDGTYDVYFTPQKYVNIGFIVSIISVVGIVTYLLIKKN